MQALNLLKYALRSRTPLSDTFLVGRRWAKAIIGEEALEIASNMQQPSNVNEERKMTMDLVVNKSNGKFLYAQAKEDVVNFFFSFLTVPLGLLFLNWMHRSLAEICQASHEEWSNKNQ